MAVVVLGSINQDVVAGVETHPVVGETVLASTLEYFPGGKGGNQAVAAARAGADTNIIGAVGDDAAGESMLSFLRSTGMNVEHVRTIDGVPTGVALIVVDALGENNIVVVPGANAFATDDGSLVLTDADVLLAQFEVPLENVVSFFRRGKAVGATTILNPAPAADVPMELVELTDVCVVNELELARLCSFDVEDVGDAAKSLPVTNVIVTLGSQGAVLVSGGDVRTVAARAVDVVDTTGAGDCFVGSVAARLSAGDKLGDAVEYANRAAAISVTRPGAASSMPTFEEVNAG